MADLIVENLVLSTQLNQSLNLKKIDSVFSNSAYEPKEFEAVVIHFHNPSRVVFITKEGKIVCTGSKTEDDAKQALNETINTLQQNKILPNGNDFETKIESVVLSTKLNVSLPLANIQAKLPANKCTYQPSTYPWLEYQEERYSMLLFSCGDIIFTGNISIEESKEAFKKIEDTLTSIGCEVTE